MNYNRHSELIDKHAFLGASKYSWLNKDSDQLLTMYSRQYIKSIGTAIHDIARKHIKHRFKLTKNAKKEVLLSVIEDYHIPGYVIDRAIDYDFVFDNLLTYVNDAIGYRMVPEQILYFSENCFGTADTITSLDDTFKNKTLRIHDLKTGATPAHIEQLLIYAALFFLEYNTKPGELDVELRIYQGNEVLCHKAEADDILPIMDRIVTADQTLKRLKEA